MDGFESWDEFGIFSQTVERKTRYVFDGRGNRFIETLIHTSEKRQRAIEKETTFWRAQLAHSLRALHRRRSHMGDDPLVIEDEMEPVGEVPTACDENRMIPRQHRAREGRVNPKGIPCLYLAEDKETALGEMRPWIGSLITAATFRTVRELCVIDCSLDYELGCQYDEEPSPDKKEKAVWSAINEAFSTPVAGSDDTANYAPTQVIAEAFRSRGYDGIRYKSSLSTGFNLALFDVASAAFIGAELYNVRTVTYSFENAEFDVPGFI